MRECSNLLTDQSHNPDADAIELLEAMKGLGTNDAVLIKILGNRSRKFIQKIKASFEERFKKPLEKWIKDETS